MTHRSIFFDAQDYQLLTLINQTVVRSHRSRNILMPRLSPSGIIELAVPVELRMASAVLRLLDTLSQGGADDRLDALAALHDEVLVMARTSLHINTGRVLVQLMKELVRAHGNFQLQLQLAHDFRQAAAGRHAVVRRLLHRYHMLEMPEDWNQAAFDNHVHDANTKGRKNSTHLIMDAWLKGIRSLTVIYYNYVSPEAARELIRASQIMGIDVRIGLLFHAPHRGRLVDLIWIPRGFSNDEEFLSFLATPSMSSLMNEGRAATRWLEKRIFTVLSVWNGTERQRLAPLLHGMPDELDSQEFFSFVGSGQASLLHLAEFIHKKLLPIMECRVAILKALCVSPSLSSQQREQSTKELQWLDSFTTESILARLTDPELFPETAQIENACDSPNCPELLSCSPHDLINRLYTMKSGCRITLNLSHLSSEDVLNLLWDCQGHISHLELFNLKDWQDGNLTDLQHINILQRAINDGSVPRLKQIILAMLRDAESAEHQDADTQTALPFKSLSHPNATLRTADASPSPRIHKLRVILQNIPVLCGYYHTRKLCATMGTDSTSRPGHRFGMGLAYPETLPLRARRELNNTKNSAHLRLPLHTDLLEQTTYDADDASRELSSITILLRKIPGLRNFGRHKHIEWIPVSENTQVCNQGQCSIASGSIPPDQGNIVTLGGNGAVPSNNFLDKKESVSFINKLFYLNTNIANILRFIIGFIPAMIVFLCTQQGLMAWLGAPLWFFISGLRNILQSVLGNGGLHRSSVLHWKSFVSWSSMYVSLMYNGLSVILLEAILRVYILKNTFHITSAEYPFLVFFILVFTCGIFKILTHVIRGLSAKNIFIDILCTLLSFPVALFYHLIFTKISFILYNNALFFVPFDVFIVKLASDTVIGIINGLLDKEQNLRRRTIDYQKRLHESLNIYSRLEVLFPEKDVLSLLSTPDVLLDKLEHVAPQLKLDLIINALDLMYFWFYQPRANHALLRRMRRFSKSERLVIFRMQQVLVQERQISQLMVDGLVGKNFAAPLSFYLARSEEYLNQMKYICLNKFA